MKSLLLLLLLPIVHSFIPFFHPTVVKTTYGTLRGKSIETENGYKGYAFLNVPYAEPPTGDRRFRPTVPLTTSWEGERKATEYGFACMSNSSFTSSPQYFVGEDCLQVNIFKSGRCNKLRKCPVIYYIHGGGWEQDSATMFPEDVMIDNFASQDVIIVIVGYRLGLFGLWSAPINDQINQQVDLDDGRGNYGVYDMIEGLRWVQAEIGAFGGDKNKVTIMGHSSGSMATHLVSLLPAAQGLFSQVVCMSGVVTDVAMDKKDPNGAEQRQFAMNNDLVMSQSCAPDGYNFANVTAEMRANITKCMREADGHDLIDFQRMYEDAQGSNMFLGPIRDGFLISKSNSDLLRDQRKHTFMTGITNNEQGFTPDPSNSFGKSNDMNCEMALEALGYDPQDRVLEVACTQFYENTTLPPYISSISELITNDLSMTLSTYEAVNYAKDAGSKVFLYQFDYSMDGDRGTHHAQDLTYVMGIHPFNYTTADKIMAISYPRYFTDFAKYGQPTKSGKWKQYTKALSNYYSINLLNAGNVFTGFHTESMKFWTEVAPTIAQMWPNHNSTHTFPEHSESTVPLQPRQPKRTKMNVIEPMALPALHRKPSVQAMNLASNTTFEPSSPEAAVVAGMPWSVVVIAIVSLIVVIAVAAYVHYRYTLSRRRMPLVEDEKQRLLDEPEQAQEGYNQLG